MYAGGICGYSANNSGEGTGISDCRSSVSLILYCSSGMGYAGGIAGQGNGIKRSYAVGSIDASKMNHPKELCIGGLAGKNSGLIEQCYATGAVSVTVAVSAYCWPGGLVGLNEGTITNSYASGAITTTGDGSGGQYAGGLVGTGTGAIEKCYASGAITGVNIGNVPAGGIIASGGSVTKSAALNPSITGYTYYEYRVQGGTTANCSQVYAFAGMTINGLTITSGAGTSTREGSSKSAADLKLASTYSGSPLGWDFATIWEMGTESYPYPVLKWQNSVVHIPHGFTPISD
jgi:hypothetical protein